MVFFLYLDLILSGVYNLYKMVINNEELDEKKLKNLVEKNKDKIFN